MDRFLAFKRIPVMNQSVPLFQARFVSTPIGLNDLQDFAPW